MEWYLKDIKYGRIPLEVYGNVLGLEMGTKSGTTDENGNIKWVGD